MIAPWTWHFLDDKKDLQVSLYGRHIKSVIEYEDITQEIHLHLQSIDKKYLCGRDIILYLDKPAVKEQLGLKIHNPNAQLLDAYHGVHMGRPRMACTWMDMNVKM